MAQLLYCAQAEDAPRCSAMGALCPSRIIVHTYICECSVYEISLCSIIVESCRFPVIEGIYLVGSCV